MKRTFAGLTDTGSRSLGEHVAQYYEKSEHLAARVVEFLAPGLQAREAVIVIATPEHRRSIAACLSEFGIDVESARRNGSYVELDARETLAVFMEGGRPNRERFLAVIGGALDHACANAGSGIVRAFGEMVNILWSDGNSTGAIALEEFWNELLGYHPFSLMCGYAASSDPSDQARIAAVHTSSVLVATKPS